MATSDSRKGGIVGCLLITMAGLVCLAVVVGLTIARNVEAKTGHSRSGDNVSIETRGGKFSIQAHDTAYKSMADVPSYPGARRSGHSAGGADFQWTSNDSHEDKGISIRGEEMITDDTVDEVVKYYRTQLPPWVVSTNHDGTIHLEANKNGQKRFVAIARKLDGTHIGLASFGEPAAN